LSAGRKHTIKITSRYGDQTGNYQISVSEIPRTAGLSKDESFLINKGETQQGTFNTTFEDWYKFTTSETKEYSFVLTNNNINAYTYITAYDNLETKLSEVRAPNGGTTTITITLEAGSTTYIKISRQYSDQFGNYTLTVS